MALSSIQTTKRPAFVQTSGESIEITATLTERHAMTADIPKVPIERGSDLTDHRQIHPVEVSIDGVISSVAMRSDGQIDDNGRVVRGNALLDGTQPFSVQEGYVRLLELFEDSQTFELVTSLRSYRDMHFASLIITRDKTTGGIISFSAVIQQLTFADSKTVTIRSKAIDKPKTPKKETPGAKKPQVMNPENKSAALKAAEVFSKKPGAAFKALLGGGG